MKKFLFLLLLAVSAVLSCTRAAEPPYRVEELPAMLEPRRAQISAAKNLARQAMRERRAPDGTETVYYASGVSSLDEWYGFTIQPQSTPPDTPSYYRFVYRGGVPVAHYRHDQTGEHLSSFFCYDQRAFPIVAVLQDAQDVPVQVTVLTYDHADRIKRILVLDGKYQPLRLWCFVHHDGYDKTESWRYDGIKKWALTARHLQEGGDYHEIIDGSRKDVPAFTRIAYMQALATVGIKPMYPGAFPKEPLPAARVPRIRSLPRAQNEGPEQTVSSANTAAP